MERSLFGTGSDTELEGLVVATASLTANWSRRLGAAIVAWDSSLWPKQITASEEVKQHKT